MQVSLGTHSHPLPLTSGRSDLFEAQMPTFTYLHVADVGNAHDTTRHHTQVQYAAAQVVWN